MGYKESIPKGIQFAEPIESPNKLASTDAHFGPYENAEEAKQAMTAYSKAGRLYGVKDSKGAVDLYIWQGSTSGGGPVGPKDYIINGVNTLPSLQLSLESPFGIWQFAGSAFSYTDPSSKRLVYRVSSSSSSRTLYLETSKQNVEKVFRVDDNSIFYGTRSGEHVSITPSSIEFATGSMSFSNHLDIYNINGLYRFRNLHSKDTDSSYEYVIVADSIGNIAVRSAKEIGKNMSNADLVLKDPRKHTGAAMELAMPVDLSNEKVTLSNIPSKKLDKNYQNIVGASTVDKSIGYVGPSTLIGLLQESTQADINQLIAIISNTYVGSTNILVTAIYPPVIDIKEQVSTLTVYGTGLHIAHDDLVTSVKILDIVDNRYYEVNYSPISRTQLKVIVPSSILKEGREYKIDILSGAFRHVTTQTFEVKRDIKKYVPVSSDWKLTTTNQQAVDENGGLVIRDNMIAIYKVPEEGNYGSITGAPYQTAAMDLSTFVKDSDDFSVKLIYETGALEMGPYSREALKFTIKNKDVSSANAYASSNQIAVLSHKSTAKTEFNFFVNGLRKAALPSALLVDIIIIKRGSDVFITSSLGSFQSFKFSNLKNIGLFVELYVIQSATSLYIVEEIIKY